MTRRKGAPGDLHVVEPMLIRLTHLAHDDTAERIAGKLAAKRVERDARRPVAPPRYDAVFLEGIAWLDGLAGDEVRNGWEERMGYGTDGLT